METNFKRVCPKCKKGILETRVKRHMIVKLIFGWMNVKRYKCHACKKKSYVWAEEQQVENQLAH